MSGASRRGITLVEILIVMAIIVAIGALSVPSIGRSFSSQKLKKAADLVRAELNRARVNSMRTGEIHAFFYQPNSSNFKVAAFNEEIARVLNDSFQNQRGNDKSRPTNFDFGGTKLPNGIQFVDGESLEDSRSASAIDENPSAGNLRPILFYPDGSSQTARLYVRSEDQDTAEVRLRGMTGTSTSSFVDLGR